MSVYLTVETLKPALIIILSNSGTTARHVARFGLSQWIVTPSHLEATCQHLHFSRGIYPEQVASEAVLATAEARRRYAREMLKRHDVDRGLVLLVEGSGTLKAEDTKRIDIIDLS